MAKDINPGQIIGHTTRAVKIEGVVDARIADQKVENHGPSSSAEAIIEVTLNVEGNLCGSSADDVSLLFKRLENGDVRLNVARLDRENDPYRLIMKACLAYAAPRQVKAVFSVNSYVYKDKPVYKTVYLIGQDDNARELIYTHTAADGIKLKLK